MTEEQIIKLIKIHPVLYNTRLSQYRDLDARNIAWEEIARKVNLNVEDVKTKWGKIRNCYTNALKRRYRKNSTELNRIMPWKFEKQLEFLIPHLKYRNKKTKPDIPVVVDGSIKDESLSPFNDEFDVHYGKPVSPASSAQYVSPIEDDIGILNPINSQQNVNSESHILREFVNVMTTSKELKYKKSTADMDDNDHFFLSMSYVLKKLPIEDQADIKFELHRLIYEAEKRQRKSNC